MKFWPVWRKWLTRLFVVLSAPVLLLYLVAWVFTTFYADDAKRYVIDQLNQQLVSKVSIHSLDFSLLKRFPYATVELGKVSAIGINGDKDLLAADRIYCLFNWYDMFSGAYQLKRIEAHNINLNLHRFANGKDNFTIWKEQQDDTSKSAPLNIDLNKVSFKNLNLRYTDDEANTRLALVLHKALFKGAFADEVFTMATEVEATANELRIADIALPVITKANLDFGTLIDRKTSRFTLDKAILYLGELGVETSGTVDFGNNPSLNLSFKGEDLNISKFISALPDEYAKYANDYTSEGNFTFDASLKGPTNALTTKANFAIGGATITYKKTGTVLSNVNLQGQLNSLPSMAQSSLNLSKIGFNLTEGSLNGSLQLVNFTDPMLTASVKANLNLARLKDFLPDGVVKRLSGRVVADVSIKTATNNLNTDAISAATGRVTLQNAELELESYHRRFSGISGIANFDGEMINVNQLKFSIGKSDFMLTGSANNFPACLLKKNTPFMVDANLISNYVLLDELLIKPRPDILKDTTYVLEISERISSNLSVNVKRLDFREFSCTNLATSLSLANRIINLSGLKLNTCDGNIAADVIIDARRGDYIKTAAEGNLSSLDIHKLFLAFENFGQTTLEAKHLKGTLNAGFSYSSAFTKDLEVVEKTIVAQSTVEVSNGELIGFEPLRAMSKFIKVEDLERIKFSTFSNTIYISDRLISIPNTEIQSNVLRLFAYGTHTFDNVIDYHVKVGLKELLKNKFLRNRPQTGTDGEAVEDDTQGGANIFLLVTGTADNPKVKYDKQAVKEKLKDDIRKEKLNLKEAIKREFNLFKGKDTEETTPETTEQNQSPKEKKGLKGLLKKKDKTNEVEKTTIDWE